MAHIIIIPGITPEDTLYIGPFDDTQEASDYADDSLAAIPKENRTIEELERP
jgi:hypothetical protein